MQIFCVAEARSVSIILVNGQFYGSFLLVLAGGGGGAELQWCCHISIFPITDSSAHSPALTILHSPPSTKGLIILYFIKALYQYYQHNNTANIPINISTRLMLLVSAVCRSSLRHRSVPRVVCYCVVLGYANVNRTIKWHTASLHPNSSVSNANHEQRNVFRSIVRLVDIAVVIIGWEESDGLERGTAGDRIGV